MDEAQGAIEAAEADLAAYLKRVGAQLGGKVDYVSLHKESHVLEVPQVRPLLSCCAVPVRAMLARLPAGRGQELDGRAGQSKCGPVPRTSRNLETTQACVKLPWVLIELKGLEHPRRPHGPHRMQPRREGSDSQRFSCMAHAAQLRWQAPAAAVLPAQALERKVPDSFERLAHRKGFVRYMSGELRRLSAGLADARAARELTLSGVLKAGACLSCAVRGLNVRSAWIAGCRAGPAWPGSTYPVCVLYTRCSSGTHAAWPAPTSWLGVGSCWAVSRHEQSDTGCRLQGLLRRFLEHRDVWAGCVEALAQVIPPLDTYLCCCLAGHGPWLKANSGPRRLQSNFPRTGLLVLLAKVCIWSTALWVLVGALWLDMCS